MTSINVDGWPILTQNDLLSSVPGYTEQIAAAVKGNEDALSDRLALIENEVNLMIAYLQRYPIAWHSWTAGFSTVDGGWFNYASSGWGVNASEGDRLSVSWGWCHAPSSNIVAVDFRFSVNHNQGAVVSDWGYGVRDLFYSQPMHGTLYASALHTVSSGDMFNPGVGYVRFGFTMNNGGVSTYDYFHIHDLVNHGPLHNQGTPIPTNSAPMTIASMSDNNKQDLWDHLQSPWPEMPPPTKTPPPGWTNPEPVIIPELVGWTGPEPPPSAKGQLP